MTMSAKMLEPPFKKILTIQYIVKKDIDNSFTIVLWRGLIGGEDRKNPKQAKTYQNTNKEHMRTMLAKVRLVYLYLNKININ
jgi:hypothetical protein